MIPRKLALRIWAACLDSQARRLYSLADGARSRRRDQAPSRQKAGGRRELADRLDEQAGVLRRWIDSDPSRGADLPDDLVGLVSAYLHQHGPSVAELRSRYSHALGGIESDDAPRLILRILGR